MISLYPTWKNLRSITVTINQMQKNCKDFLSSLQDKCWDGAICQLLYETVGKILIGEFFPNSKAGHIMQIVIIQSWQN